MYFPQKLLNSLLPFKIKGKKKKKKSRAIDLLLGGPSCFRPRGFQGKRRSPLATQGDNWMKPPILPKPKVYKHNFKTEHRKFNFLDLFCQDEPTIQKIEIKLSVTEKNLNQRVNISHFWTELWAEDKHVNYWVHSEYHVGRFLPPNHPIKWMIMFLSNNLP